MIKRFHFLNIVLGLIIVSQLRVWLSGPFSGYLFFLTFIGLALICLGAYRVLKWNKLSIFKKSIVVAEAVVGLALIFEYEPVVGFLLRF